MGPPGAPWALWAASHGRHLGPWAPWAPWAALAGRHLGPLGPWAPWAASHGRHLGPLGPWDPWAASHGRHLGPLGPWVPWAASGRAPLGPLGTRAQGPGPGTRDQGPGPGTRDQGPGPGTRARDQGPGPRDQGPGPRAQTGLSEGGRGGWDFDGGFSGQGGMERACRKASHPYLDYYPIQSRVVGKICKNTREVKEKKTTTGGFAFFIFPSVFACLPTLLVVGMVIQGLGQHPKQSELKIGAC